MKPLLFNNQYRIPSARLQNWNYANAGMYFITICTKNRENYFGEIVAMHPDNDGRDAMHRVSAAATQRDADAMQTQRHADAMPAQRDADAMTAQRDADAMTAQRDADAMHRVSTLIPTEIGKIAYSEWFKTIELRPDMNLELGEFVVMPNHIHGIIMIGANEYNTPLPGDGRDAMHRFSTVPTHCDADAMHRVSTFAPQSKNLASIIRGYKSAVTTYARKNGIEFEWQPRFYDHVIRSMDDYYRISNYIIQNPDKWFLDKFWKR